LIHFGTREFYPQISQIPQIFKTFSAKHTCLRINLKLKTENLKLRR